MECYNENQIQTINFDLRLPYGRNDLPVDLMIARQYNKQHILLCFEELSKIGFGDYIKGTQGRNNCARFIPNKNCPQTYELRLKPKKCKEKRKLIIF